MYSSHTNTRETTRHDKVKMSCVVVNKRNISGKRDCSPFGFYEREYFCSAFLSANPEQLCLSKSSSLKFLEMFKCAMLGCLITLGKGILILTCYYGQKLSASYNNNFLSVHFYFLVLSFHDKTARLLHCAATCLS